MKAYLMFENKNFNALDTPMYNAEVTVDDIEMAQILNVMSQKDENILSVCKNALQMPLTSLDEILYRQDVLRDVINKDSIVRTIYDLVDETIKKVNKYFFGLRSTNPRNVYMNTLDYIENYFIGLKEFRKLADKHKKDFQSKGFLSLFQMIQDELSNDYLKRVDDLLAEMKHQDGIYIKVSLGDSLMGKDYTLIRMKGKPNGLKWLSCPSIKIKDDERDSKKDFDYRQDLALNEVANALVQSSEHLEAFFTMLRNELAFYVGILNLKDKLEELSMPFCIPKLYDSNEKIRIWEDLYDVALVCKKNSKVIANSDETKKKSLFIITGANQGGKTTFLRSTGQSSLMAQCGMIVGAKRFEANIHSGIFTHFKKEEDKKIKSGKLDEELLRMSGIIDHLGASPLILFNESFTSTNEREGSEINETITNALINHNATVFSVTHLYTFSSLYLDCDYAEFLKAQRESDGGRSHFILKGLPEKTAYGEDLYKKVFE